MTDTPTPAEQRRVLELQSAQATLALAQDDQTLAQALLDALAKPDVAALRTLVDGRYDPSTTAASSSLNRQLSYLKSVFDGAAQGLPTLRDTASDRVRAAQAAVDAASA